MGSLELRLNSNNRMIQWLRASRFLSLVLRHTPEAASVTLDEHGWADVEALLQGVSKRHPLTMEQLEEIVRMTTSSDILSMTIKPRFGQIRDIPFLLMLSWQHANRRNCCITEQEKSIMIVSWKADCCQKLGYMSIYQKTLKPQKRLGYGMEHRSYLQ